MSDGYKISRLTMLWIMVFLVFACFIVTFKFTNDYWKVELIKRGHARWVVKDDKGNVEWQWIEKK